ncbi:MAG: hypothetical protein ACK5LM_02710 [Lactovum sp.]
MKKNQIFPLSIVISALNILANGFLVFFNGQLPSIFSIILSIFLVINAFIALVIAYQAYKLMEKAKIDDLLSKKVQEKEEKKIEEKNLALKMKEDEKEVKVPETIVEVEEGHE